IAALDDHPGAAAGAIVAGGAVDVVPLAPPGEKPWADCDRKLHHESLPVRRCAPVEARIGPEKSSRDSAVGERALVSRAREDIILSERLVLGLVVHLLATAGGDKDEKKQDSPEAIAS